MLRKFRDRFLLPYLNPDHTIVEIGPGGGRWTRYMLSSLTLYVVDYHQELLDVLAENFKAPGLRLIKNNGSDFPGIPDECVDFIFSYAVFIQLDVDIIESYLSNMRRLLKPTGCAVIQYSDKTKIAAQRDPTYSMNNPTIMREMVLKQDYRIVEEDTEDLRHSSVIRFTL
jgi:ubiquinone/menaquinone biosynthesis C-methylase UbiE